MDIVFINDLEVKTVIGVYDWERKIRQRLVFNIELGCDLRLAGETDDLMDTFDYYEISKAIYAFTEESEFQLIEVLAESVSKMVMNKYGIKWISLSLQKPDAVDSCKSVGVKIERGKRF
jgi:7,8-dihydroneopterin aldolase/epimerase/oxygenase